MPPGSPQPPAAPAGQDSEAASSLPGLSLHARAGLPEAAVHLACVNWGPGAPSVLTMQSGAGWREAGSLQARTGRTQAPPTPRLSADSKRSANAHPGPDADSEDTGPRLTPKG